MAPSFTPPLARRAVFSITSAALFGVLAVGACLPDAEGDYEDYAKSADAARKVQGGGGEEAGGGGGAEPGGIPDVNGTFHVSCLPSLASEDTTDSIRFLGEVTLEKTAEDAGTITLSLTPLKVETTSTADVLGTPLAGSAPVGADRKFTLNFAAVVDVPGEANPISGSPISISNGSVTGILLSADAFCAELNGQVTTPTAYPLDGASVDVCLFERVVGTSIPPILDLAKYKCPGTR